jgi:hypothetical protein
VSSKPGGFITGAGHGSTFKDLHGNWWHASTMRISVNHTFERRVGIFPASFDNDGLFCINQNFSDYPLIIPDSKVKNIWEELFPGWMLLSYKKHTYASSFAPGFSPDNAVNEDIRNYWVAADNKPGHYICVDLGRVYQINAIQINLGDHKIPQIKFPEEQWVGGDYSKRFIDSNCGMAEYTVEISEDDKKWQIIKDMRGNSEDHTHEYIYYEKPIKARYVRTTGYKMPYDAPFTVSGIRVFGSGAIERPAKVANIEAHLVKPTNINIRWQASNGADGYNVRYGISKEKLYSSWLLYEKTELDLGMITEGQSYFIRVDAFNENGITEGDMNEIKP